MSPIFSINQENKTFRCGKVPETIRSVRTGAFESKTVLGNCFSFGSENKERRLNTN